MANPKETYCPTCGKDNIRVVTGGGNYDPRNWHLDYHKGIGGLDCPNKTTPDDAIEHLKGNRKLTAWRHGEVNYFPAMRERVLKGGK